MSALWEFLALDNRPATELGSCRIAQWGTSRHPGADDQGGDMAGDDRAGDDRAGGDRAGGSRAGRRRGITTLGAALAVWLLAAASANAASFNIKQSAFCTSGCSGFIGISGSISAFSTGYFKPSELDTWSIFIQPSGVSVPIFLNEKNSTVTSAGSPTFESAGGKLYFAALTAADGVTFSGKDSTTGQAGSWALGYGVFHTATFANVDGTIFTAVDSIIKPPFNEVISTSFGTPGPIVPIPAAAPLLATALAGLGALGWRRRKSLNPAT